MPPAALNERSVYNVITCTVGNNLKRRDYIFERTVTLREAFDKGEVAYAQGTSTLDGAPLQPGDLDKSFEEIGIKGDRCFLFNVVKADNAA